MVDSQKFCPECGAPKSRVFAGETQPTSVGPVCENGHAMLNRDMFCPECGAPKKDPRPSQTAPNRAAVATAQRSADTDLAFVLLVVGAVASLIVIAVLMFTTPHASYNAYYYPSGATSPSVETTSSPCITAWRNMVGNLDVNTSANQIQADNTQSASNACGIVIHGRQHLSILFLVIAVACGVVAAIRLASVRRRRMLT
jgi:rubredoxin